MRLMRPSAIFPAELLPIDVQGPASDPALVGAPIREEFGSPLGETCKKTHASQSQHKVSQRTPRRVLKRLAQNL
jgi:hypothetical protein